MPCALALCRICTLLSAHCKMRVLNWARPAGVVTSMVGSSSQPRGFVCHPAAEVPSTSMPMGRRSVQFNCDGKVVPKL